MTPAQLVDAFAFVERTGHRVTVVQVNAMEFEDIVRQALPHSIFESSEGNDDATADNGFQGTAWGARVVYRPGMPTGQILVSGRSPQKDVHPRFVEYLLDIEPTVRPHIETIDHDKFEDRAWACKQKLKDIRDHVALYGHTALAVEHTSEPVGARTDRDTEPSYIEVWRVACFAKIGMTVKESDLCQCTWTITEEDVAAAGRFDLVDRFGWGAEIEAAKRTPSRERPLVWQKVGTFLDD